MSEADRSVQLDEVALVRRVARGEEEAVAAFCQTYTDDLFHFVYRRVGEQYEDAEEITQDAFLSAVSLASTYDESCPVFTWLCGIAKLRIVDFYRHQGRGQRIPPDKVLTPDEETLRTLQDDNPVAAIDDMINRLDAARLVDVMMTSLTEEERESLLLHYVEGYSLREMAGLTERSLKAIRHLLARAHKKALAASRHLWEEVMGT